MADSSTDFMIRQLLLDPLIERHLVLGDADLFHQAVQLDAQLGGDARTTRIVDAEFGDSAAGLCGGKRGGEFVFAAE